MGITIKKVGLDQTAKVEDLGVKEADKVGSSSILLAIAKVQMQSEQLRALQGGGIAKVDQRNDCHTNTYNDKHTDNCSCHDPDFTYKFKCGDPSCHNDSRVGGHTDVCSCLPCSKD